MWSATGGGAPLEYSGIAVILKRREVTLLCVASNPDRRPVPSAEMKGSPRLLRDRSNIQEEGDQVRGVCKWKMGDSGWPPQCSAVESSVQSSMTAKTHLFVRSPTDCLHMDE